LPVFVFGAEEAAKEGGTDILRRLVNFAIFAAILYYLVADKIKAFFTNRTKEIAKQLSSLQEKVEETKELKQKAMQKLKDAEEEAKELIELAKKEAELQIQKLENSIADEIKYMQKSYESKKELLEKKMTSEVVENIIEKIFSKDGVKITEEELVNIITKKVA